MLMSYMRNREHQSKGWQAALQQSRCTAAEKHVRCSSCKDLDGSSPRKDRETGGEDGREAHDCGEPGEHVSCRNAV